MILVTAATTEEISPLARRYSHASGISFLVTGVGCLETSVSLGRYLSNTKNPVNAVFNCGVAGAFVGAGAALLDVCLASEEILADFGISFNDEIADFAQELAPTAFVLDRQLLTAALDVFSQNGIEVKAGPFATVNAVSGRQARGDFFRRRHNALCENMEGAAVARVCQEFSLPCLELRCVSNLVQDRDTSSWDIAGAIVGLCNALNCLLDSNQFQKYL